MKNRREVIGLCGLGLLAGCSTAADIGQTAQQVTTTVNQVGQDVQILTDGLSKTLSNLNTITGVGASVVTSVQGWLADAQQVAAAVVSATADGVRGLVTNLASDVTSIVNALRPSTGSLPALVTTVLQAAQTILPVILGAAGIPFAGPNTGMSVTQARLLLKAAAS